jgi:hypothetical protein
VDLPFLSAPKVPAQPATRGRRDSPPISAPAEMDLGGCPSAILLASAGCLRRKAGRVHTRQVRKEDPPPSLPRPSPAPLRQGGRPCPIFGATPGLRSTREEDAGVSPATQTVCPSGWRVRGGVSRSGKSSVWRPSAGVVLPPMPHRRVKASHLPPAG